ncbi:MAG: 8-oxo-dGTP diphosphatase [Erysipelotrichaceae bacterium]|nr:8-oxo-dGTP diphosphatase [Erysipelotrichaceae bacterium]
MKRKPEKTIFTNICLVYQGDQILVQERHKKDWPGLTFPGGHVENGENFHDAVIREVKEETGLKLKRPVLCGIEEFKTEEEDRYIMLYYKCNDFTGKLKSSKEGEVFWINKNDLDKYKLSLDLKRIYKIMTSEELSEIIYYYDKNGKWRSKIV